MNNIYANRIVNNVGGLELFGEGSNNAFHDNYVAQNTYGVLLSHTYLKTAGENNTVYHNSFVDNTEQINSRSTYHANYGIEVRIYPIGNYDNGKEGNYWNDYHGKDVDGNGIGDTPFGKDRYPLMHPWGAPSISNVELNIDSGNVSLIFKVDKPTSWMGYSLDGLDNVTIDGNVTFIASSGFHNVTVYAKDIFENTGNSETIFFSIEKPEAEQELFATTLMIGLAIAVTVVAFGLLLYRRHRKNAYTMP